MNLTTPMPARARRCGCIGPDPQNWVPERADPDGRPIDHNVVIVGGGQSGCAFAWALRRAGIGRVSVIDMAEDENRAGVWRNAARMNVLRTPKTLPGPELGIPALGFQAWYEARHGSAAYDAFARIPREAWAEYLAWYRRFLGIAVRYRTRLARIEPADGVFPAASRGGRTARRSRPARKVILANGVAGNGGPYIPPVLSEGLPRALYAHTADAIDFAALRGKRVAVIGGAASAFDAAAVALEEGAASVHLFARRPSLAAMPISRVKGYPGAYDNYGDLPDDVRWHQAIRFRRAGSTAPADAIERVMRFANFRLHLAAPWEAAAAEDGEDRGAGGRRGLPFRLRDRRHRVFRRSRRRARNWPIFPPISCAGATATCRRRTRRTTISGRIRISGPGTSIWKGRRAPRRICATSMSTTRPASSASAGPRATCRACGGACRRSSRASAATCSWPISMCIGRRLTADVAPEFGEELYRGAVGTGGEDRRCAWSASAAAALSRAVAGRSNGPGPLSDGG